jgi:YfiH family protein
MILEEYISQVQYGFERRQRGGVVFFTIPSFDKCGRVKAGFTSRVGGVSQGCYKSLNFSLKREGSIQNLQENFRRAAGALGVPFETLVLDNYEHGDGIYHATPNDCGKGLLRETDLPKCDALIIDEPGVTAVTLHADCVPVFFLDPVRRAACVAHAGWRGVYQCLPQKITDTLINRYGCKKEDILAAVGPHIMKGAFEVGEDVSKLFEERFGINTVIKREGRIYADMQTALLAQFMEAGLEPQNITCANLCTYSLPELFYSHRRDKGMTGAMASLIAFNQER